jgi:hypothetical protein
MFDFIFSYYKKLEQRKKYHNLSLLLLEGYSKCLYYLSINVTVFPQLFKHSVVKYFEVMYFLFLHKW